MDKFVVKAKRPRLEDEAKIASVNIGLRVHSWFIHFVVPHLFKICE